MKGVCLFLLMVFGGNGGYAKNEKQADLNTAIHADYLSRLEKEVIYELNLFRSNPAVYTRSYIAPLAKYYNKKILNYPGDTPVLTKEGVRALHECVKVLEKETSLPVLYPDKSLALSARDHQRDLQATGNRGHVGSDRSTLQQRIERYGKWQYCIGEDIAYGNSSARQVVISLLIDDGVKKRGHRKSLLTPDFKFAGVACGSHPGYRTVCVIDFAGGMNSFSP